MRRVVVTGLGAITPLGVGIRQTWKRLLASESGLASVAHLEPAPRWRELPSTVAGIVPQGSKAEGKWQASDWLEKGDERRMAKFTQYAIAATEMALVDAGWRPHTQVQRETAGVCLGSGIGNLEELYNTSIAYDKAVSYTDGLCENHAELCLGLQKGFSPLRPPTPYQPRCGLYFDEVWLARAKPCRDNSLHHWGSRYW